MKKILGIDFDDVLFDFNSALSVFHNREYGTNYTRTDIKTWHLNETWECSYDEVAKRVFEFYNSDDHAAMEPVAGAIEALAKLGETHDLVVVTSRSESIEPQTVALIDRHYPNLFSEVIFTNHFAQEKYGGSGGHMTKGDVCRTCSIAAFVDDSFDHAKDVASHGVRSFLFDAPWNQQQEHPRLERVFSWNEVAERLGYKVYGNL